MSCPSVGQVLFSVTLVMGASVCSTEKMTNMCTIGYWKDEVKKKKPMFDEQEQLRRSKKRPCPAGCQLDMNIRLNVSSELRLDCQHETCQERKKNTTMENGEWHCFSTSSEPLKLYTLTCCLDEGDGRQMPAMWTFAKFLPAYMEPVCWANVLLPDSRRLDEEEDTMEYCVAHYSNRRGRGRRRVSAAMDRDVDLACRQNFRSRSRVGPSREWCFWSGEHVVLCCCDGPLCNNHHENPNMDPVAFGSSEHGSSRGDSGGGGPRPTARLPAGEEGEAAATIPTISLISGCFSRDLCLASAIAASFMFIGLVTLACIARSLIKGKVKRRREEEEKEQRKRQNIRKEEENQQGEQQTMHEIEAAQYVPLTEDVTETVDCKTENEDWETKEPRLSFTDFTDDNYQ